jgi:hypothetical protein
MKKFLTAVLLTGFVGTVPARSGQQDVPVVRAQKAVTEKDSTKPLTITGCVAQSDRLYRLDHAIVGTDPDVDTQNRPATEASPTPKTISYALVGADLKAHLGHKVEVTAIISTDKISKDHAEIKGVPGTKLAGTLNVKSVKMISKTCP